MWLVYTLVAAVCFGVGQVLVKKGLQNTSALFNNALAVVVQIVVMLPYAFIMGVHFDHFLTAFLYSMLVSALFLSFYYIIGLGKISLTGTIISTYPLITVILSLIFLHENPTAIQKVAIVLTIVGAICMAMPDKIKEFRQHLGGWFFWAIVGAFASGFGDFFSKVAIDKTDTYTYIFAYPLGSAVVTILNYFVDKKGRRMPSFRQRGSLPTLIGVSTIEVGLFFFYLAIGSGLISLVSPISSVYVAITVILAFIFLHERINRIQTIGILLSFAGILLVGGAQ
jgi:transporter family protein